MVDNFLSLDELVRIGDEGQCLNKGLYTVEIPRGYGAKKGGSLMLAHWAQHVLKGAGVLFINTPVPKMPKANGKDILHVVERLVYRAILICEEMPVQYKRELLEDYSRGYPAEYLRVEETRTSFSGGGLEVIQEAWLEMRRLRFVYIRDIIYFCGLEGKSQKYSMAESIAEQLMQIASRLDLVIVALMPEKIQKGPQA